MKQILAYLIEQLGTTLMTIAAVKVSEKAQNLLNKMVKDPIDSDLATQQLIAARYFALYGLPGLRTLVDHQVIADFILLAYIVRYDLGATYPASGYVPDSQPNPFVDPEDFTNDAIAYKKVVTFLASRNSIDYSLVQKAFQ